MKRSGTPRLSEQGSTLAIIAVFMVALLGTMAIAVDLGFLLYVRTHLQATADASALAAAQELPDLSGAVTTAQAYSTANAGNWGTVVAASDVTIGHWDKGAWNFTAGGSPTNAVRVIARRSSLNGNPVGLWFARFVGQSEAGVVALAIALGPNCFDNGLTAGGQVTLGQDIRLDQYCIYGRDGVSMGQDPHANNGSLIGALDITTITYGQDPRCDGGPFPPCLYEGDHEPILAQMVEQLIDDLEFGPPFPPGITNVNVGNTLPSSLNEGTAYVINGNVHIGQDYAVKNVIIAARGNVTWGQDGAVRNTGSPTSDPAIGVYATGDMIFGQDPLVIGAHLIAGQNLTIDQDIRGLDASIQVGGDAYIAQDPHFKASWPGFGQRIRLVG